MLQFLHVVDNIVETKWLVPLLVLAGLGLMAAVVVAPDRSPQARASYDDADISPLWPAAGPVVMIAAMLLQGFIPFLPMLAALAHIGFSGWIVYRHRRWLWAPLPLAVMSVLWTILLAGVSVMMGVWGQIGH